MTFELELPAGVLGGHMKRASFCSDIQDILLDIGDGTLKTYAVGAANDRIAMVETAIDTPESIIIGIPKVSAVVDKISNFKPEEMISLLIDDKNQMKLVRKKPKKSYSISTVEELKHIRSKSPYDIYPDLEEMTIKVEVNGKAPQNGGNIISVMKIPDLAAAQKVFKNRDVFTDEVELTIKTDGTSEIWGRDEDDLGLDSFEVDMIKRPTRDFKSGYSGLIEVIKALNPKANITIYGGDGNISLLIVEDMNTEEEQYRSRYVVMPRVLRWR